jgi:RNA polymerase sigma-70 factor, ECF subfamily
VAGPVAGRVVIMRRTHRVRYARFIPRNLDDAALVAAAQGGDRFALDQLLRRHYDRIHAVCRRVAGSTREADDACQEALIKIVRSLPRFDGRSTFGTWAYRIATNASLDELRKRQRRPTLHAVGEEDRPELVDAMADRFADSFPDRLLLDDALDRLPEDLRMAVVLRDVADFDYAEIAETLDVPVGTVKSRISRGRAALATQLRLDQDLQSGTRGNRPPPDERPTDPT